MSYDIYLVDDNDNVLELDSKHQLKGGTYELGGTKQCWLNITYNYGGIFRKVLGDNGIRSIYGILASDSIPILKNAIEQLGTNESDSYWEDTEGNACKALHNLLDLAYKCPHGRWKGD